MNTVRNDHLLDTTTTGVPRYWITGRHISEGVGLQVDSREGVGLQVDRLVKVLDYR